MRKQRRSRREWGRIKKHEKKRNRRKWRGK